ncbi:hypothetical protein F4780DRAFT_780373 [Xylariomycetidae sp. FL0641]|nr:hypothetical protein F4780DRAFT_780373 [Xylariomycetidae sp. FL0641]
MLLRQLQRPLLRPVAAAWRPAPLALLHGSSPSRSDTQLQSESEATPANDDTTVAPKKSLFEKLFPDEARKAAALRNSDPDGSNSPTPAQSLWAADLAEEDDEPPRMALDEELKEFAAGLSEDTHHSPFGQDFDGLGEVALRAKSMLILSAASKHLLESDFLRLGQKGKHVEGWVSGILKVIQARHPDTLAPQGHYFILFDTQAAAETYQAEATRRWELGKRYVAGAHHAQAHRWAAAPPTAAPGVVTERGTSAAASVAAFTLVPSSAKLRLRPSTAAPGPERLDTGGAALVAGRLAARCRTPHLVLLRLEGGRLPLAAVRAAVRQDGQHRALPWRILDREVEEPGSAAGRDDDTGILPFGSSGLRRARRREFEEGVRAAALHQADEESAARGEDPRGGGGEEDMMMETPLAHMDEAEARQYREYARFVIPFADDAEAQRFVRCWHRRELQVQVGAENSGVEANRLINATVLW